MNWRLRLLIFCSLGVAVAAVLRSVRPPLDRQSDVAIAAARADHQYNLPTGGREFLLNEAAASDFFLLGELHGDNEIPHLLKDLWREMWKQGYRHIAGELSPWAAHQLELVPAGKGPEVLGLWTKREVEGVHAFATPHESVLWGCDMEEVQPQLLVPELAKLNPHDSSLHRMVELTKNGYSREKAAELLELLTESPGRADKILNGISVHQNLLATLQIEKNRLGADTKMIAQNAREQLMKKQFLEHFDRASRAGTASKVLLRFGRNHLHRGYDARGISTLGNFVAELALLRGKNAFNVGAFGAGGRAALLGSNWDADERQDELAFALLAEKANYPATLFDLRPLRALLHDIPSEKRSETQRNLTYWADSYDALICYKTVTPLEP
jgi:hypothetical protein